MKSRDTLIRLKRFQVEEKRRRVRQIEMMTAEFNRMIGDLDREIANEEKRSGISDPTHFAYPTYARAAIGRRDNLKSSIAELSAQIEEAKLQLESIEATLPAAKPAHPGDPYGWQEPSAWSSFAAVRRINEWICAPTLPRLSEP